MNFHTIPGPGSYGRHSNIDTCIVCTCTYRAESLKRRRMTLGLVQCRLLWVRCKNQPTTAHTICNHMHRARTDIHLFFHAFRWIDISFYCKNTPTPSYHLVQSSSQINRVLWSFWKFQIHMQGILDFSEPYNNCDVYYSLFSVQELMATKINWFNSPLKMKVRPIIL